MSGPLIVAIDGPSGSGKSTVARGVASALGLEMLDTGAMYRGVTLLALERGVALDDAEALGALADGVAFAMGPRVLLDGRDVTGAIRAEAVTAAVSQVAAWPSVRAVLVKRQRDWMASRPGGVVEGRDIGSVVFPEAQVKVYLTASERERARRRQTELAAAGTAGELTETQLAIARRDALDSSRAAAPLLVAAGAVVIDSTSEAADAVIRRITALAEAARR